MGVRHLLPEERSIDRMGVVRDLHGEKHWGVSGAAMRAAGRLRKLGMFQCIRGKKDDLRGGR